MRIYFATVAGEFTYIFVDPTPWDSMTPERIRTEIRNMLYPPKMYPDEAKRVAIPVELVELRNVPNPLGTGSCHQNLASIKIDHEITYVVR